MAKKQVHGTVKLIQFLTKFIYASKVGMHILRKGTKMTTESIRLSVNLKRMNSVKVIWILGSLSCADSPC